MRTYFNEVIVSKSWRLLKLIRRYKIIFKPLFFRIIGFQLPA